MTEILLSARARIEDESAWTRGELARNSEGRACAPSSSEAISWDALGALLAEYGKRSTYDLDEAEGFLGKNPDQFSDKSHAHALKLYDRAIAAVRGDQEALEEIEEEIKDIWYFRLASSDKVEIAYGRKLEPIEIALDPTSLIDNY